MATIEKEQIRKRFFIEGQNDKGKKCSFPVQYAKNMVIFTTDWNDKIVFSKSNRSVNFTDSREPKKRFSREEIRAEILRMSNQETAATAMMALIAA